MGELENEALIQSWEIQQLTIHAAEFTDFLSDTRGPMMMSERFRDAVESRRHPELDTFVWLPAVTSNERGERRRYFYAFFPDWPELHMEHTHTVPSGKELKTRSPICERTEGRAMFRPSNPYDFNLIVSSAVAQAAVDDGFVGVRFDAIRCISEVTGQRYPSESARPRRLQPRSRSTAFKLSAEKFVGSDVSGFISSEFGPKCVAGGWDQIERNAVAATDEILNPRDVTRMREIDLSVFQEAIAEMLRSVKRRTDQRQDIAGLYWEFDPHNNAATLLMMGRTLAAFGRAYDQVGRSRLPFGIGVHDTGLLMMLPRV